MAKIKSYRHITYTDRCHIEAYMKSGKSNAWIAQELVHRSSIDREIKKNSSKRGYRCKHAQEKASKRKKHANRALRKWTLEVCAWIEEKIKLYFWSPEQIAMSAFISISGRIEKMVAAFINTLDIKARSTIGPSITARLVGAASRQV